MADDDFQKEPPRPDSRPELRPQQPEDDRFRQPDLARNRTALIAFRLGALSLVPLGVCVTGPYWAPAGGSGLGETLAFLCVFLSGGIELLLGPAALIYGIKGVRHRIRNPTAGGLGSAVFGIIMGVVISLLSWVAAILLVIGILTGQVKIGVPGAWK